MRLQSKKTNPPLPRLIAVVFLFSMIYWAYLGVATKMNIIFDAASYESLGRTIQAQGWKSYFSGVNREPLYPLLVALSMHLEHLTGLSYMKVMAFFDVIIMSLTQILMYKILRILNIRTGICALILAYVGLSPAFNNSAFSLYSEIATYPFILSIILLSFFTAQDIKANNGQKACMHAAVLGALLAASTLIKAVFECITPIYLIIFFAMILRAEKNSKKMTISLCCLASAACFYYVPVTGYKWLNLHYNGNFVVTSRGSWALYGNTARRMEPLTFKRFAEALAYVPGEGVCNSLFGTQECDFWSYRKSDAFGFTKRDDLGGQKLSSDQINNALLKASAQKALQNPFQYALLTVVEGFKMFFWESTQLGFVSYPPWLQKIYDIRLLNNALRSIVSLACLWAMVWLWARSLMSFATSIEFFTGIMVFLYILFYSFFFILPRYGLPIAPLFLITIGLWLEQNLGYLKKTK